MKNRCSESARDINARVCVSTELRLCAHATFACLRLLSISFCDDVYGRCARKDSSCKPRFHSSTPKHFQSDTLTITSSLCMLASLAVVQRQLAPLLDALAPVLNVTVSTQIVHFAEGTPAPLFDNATKSYFVSADSLHAYMSVSALPKVFLPSTATQLIFLVHIPHPRVSPLELRTSMVSSAENNTFSVPHWGAVHAIKYDEPTVCPWLLILGKTSRARTHATVLWYSVATISPDKRVSLRMNVVALILTSLHALVMMMLSVYTRM